MLVAQWLRNFFFFIKEQNVVILSFWNKLRIPFLLWEHKYIILEQVIVLFSHVSCILWQAAQEAYKAVENNVRLEVVSVFCYNACRPQ